MNPDQPEDRTRNEDRPTDQPACAGSMHDNVEVWEDCCVCEPEPRWQALAEELEGSSAPQPVPTKPAKPTSPPGRP